MKYEYEIMNDENKIQVKRINNVSIKRINESINQHVQCFSRKYIQKFGWRIVFTRK